MDKIFVRNFALFVVILLFCAGTLTYSLLSGDKELKKTGDLVLHTHDVITEAERLSTFIEGLLSSQRGYLLTGTPEFYASFENMRAQASNRIAALSELVADDKSQESRLDEIRHNFNTLSTMLEERAKTFEPPADQTFLDDIGTIQSVKDNILRINSDILEEEYQVLNETVIALENKKSQYFTSLIVGVLVGTILLLLFNAFLLSAQRKRTRVEETLKDTETRLSLAIEGTQDGIFDWDIKSGEIFYSRQFWAMLGYDRDSGIGKTDDVSALIHPEDSARVWDYVEKYLRGELSEYSQEFRMKSESGHWMWVQSRAKAKFDSKGNAVRLVGAHTDITYLKEAQERLKHEKHEAEEANRSKSDFLAHMSHEIRTPLTAINGIAEIFSKNMVNLDDKQKQLVDTLRSSTSNLKDLINDILDFSKIESGEVELNNSSFELAELFQSVIDMMSLRANEKGISFVFDYSALAYSEFWGDDVRIRQILVNLVGNAIKFTDEGGVSVKAYTEARNGLDFLRVDVSDTGIGISHQYFDVIFERFKQADASVSRKYGGTGLGLPISRNLAYLMGGDIILSSQPGKGSTFSLLLPVKDLDDLPAGHQEDKQLHKKLDDKIRTALDDSNKILIVEDYEGNIVVLSYMLDDLGCAYDIARTGQEALDLWREHYYDIILMDIQMPEMDGFTATKTIRSEEREKHMEATPIIGMTAHALVGDKSKCIEAGMDAYLPKPIVAADLKKKILKYLKARKKKAA